MVYCTALIGRRKEFPRRSRSLKPSTTQTASGELDLKLDNISSHALSFNELG